MGSFWDVLCVRARLAAHSGSLEATAAALGLRRLTREARHHRSRGSSLVDAQAVMGALNKGRSSSGILGHPVSQAAALLLAADLKMRFAYLPSELNPAGALSRGFVRH